MSPNQKEKLKRKIEMDILSLQVEVDSLKKQIKPVTPDSSIGRLTRLEAINAKSMSEANLRNAHKRLEKLAKALAQIDDEEFGICVVCDEPIPMGRMMLMPESTICVKCKEMMAKEG